MKLWKFVGWIRMNTAKKYPMRHSPCYTYDFDFLVYVIAQTKERAYTTAMGILVKQEKKMEKKYPLGGEVLPNPWAEEIGTVYDEEGKRL
jgi:hypothetical protein